MKYSTRKENSQYFSIAYLKHHEGHGWFLIDILTEKAERLIPNARFFLAPPLLNLNHLTIKEIKRKGKRTYIKFLETESFSKPEVVLKRYLQIPFSEARELEADEFWFHEIIGLKCFTLEGKYLGEVTSIIKTGVNDVYSVENGKYLVPAIKEVVKEVRLKEGKMLIKEIPGLLEL